MSIPTYYQGIGQFFIEKIEINISPSIHAQGIEAWFCAERWPRQPIGPGSFVNIGK
jgi:hypothetical protein